MRPTVRSLLCLLAGQFSQAGRLRLEAMAHRLVWLGALSPLRRELVKDSAQGLEVKKGKVTAFGNHKDCDRAWATLDMMERFVHELPDFKSYHTANDGPHIYLNGDERKRLEDLVDAGRCASLYIEIAVSSLAYSRYERGWRSRLLGEGHPTADRSDAANLPGRHAHA